MQYHKLQERKINHDLLFDKENIDNDLICSICSCLLVDNRQGCSEGHVFCYGCINRWLEKSKTCPSCRREIKSSEFLLKNRFIEKAIEKLYIYCPNKFAFDNVDDNDGCKEIITIGDKKLHLEKCQFKFVKCENVGCNLVIRLNEKDHHEKEECEFTLYECKNQGCNLILIKSKISSHQDEECPFGLIPCKNHHCGELIQRNLYDDHSDFDCKFELIDCEYKNSGCKVKFERGEIDDHYSQINHTFFKIINDQNILFSDALLKVQNQLNDSKKVINDQKLLLQISNEALKITTDSLLNLQDEFTESKKIIDNQKSILKNTNHSLSNVQNELNQFKKIVVNGMSYNEVQSTKILIKKTPLVVNEKWALVSNSWYKKWENLSHTKEQLTPIGNEDILENGILKKSIIEGTHYILVPEKVWTNLKSVYGGQDIIRRVVEKSSKKLVELYPPRDSIFNILINMK